MSEENETTQVLRQARELISDPERDARDVAVAHLVPWRAKGGLPWSWEDEDRNTRTRQCLCCGKPGHYQAMLEEFMRGNGTHGLAVLVGDGGFVKDGHHRVLAARRLGIDMLPLETEADARARWLKDHGPVDWSDRKVGDR